MTRSLALSLVMAMSLLWSDGAAAKPDPVCVARCKADRIICLAGANAEFLAGKVACPGAGPTRRSCLRQARGTHKQAQKSCQRLRRTTCLPCCRAGRPACSGLPTTTLSITTSSTTSTSSTSTTLAPSIDLALPPGAITTTLGTTGSFGVFLTSDRYAGNVALSVEGLPSTWSGSFDPSDSVTIAADGTANVMLNVIVPQAAEATTATITVRATPSPPSVSRTRTASMTVQNEFVIRIAAGTGSGNHGFPAAVFLRPGARLTWRNDDSTEHIIHGDGIIPHQNVSGAGNGYSILLDGVGPGDTGHFYCHSHGQGTGEGNLTIIEPGP